MPTPRFRQAERAWNKNRRENPIQQTPGVSMDRVNADVSRGMAAAHSQTQATYQGMMAGRQSMARMAPAPQQRWGGAGNPTMSWRNELQQAQAGMGKYSPNYKPGMQAAVPPAGSSINQSAQPTFNANATAASAGRNVRASQAAINPGTASAAEPARAATGDIGQLQRWQQFLMTAKPDPAKGITQDTINQALTRVGQQLGKLPGLEAKTASLEAAAPRLLQTMASADICTLTKQGEGERAIGGVHAPTGMDEQSGSMQGMFGRLQGQDNSVQSLAQRQSPGTAEGKLAPQGEREAPFFIRSAIKPGTTMPQFKLAEDMPTGIGDWYKRKLTGVRDWLGEGAGKAGAVMLDKSKTVQDIAAPIKAEVDRNNPQGLLSKGHVAVDKVNSLAGTGQEAVDWMKANGGNLAKGLGAYAIGMPLLSAIPGLMANSQLSQMNARQQGMMDGTMSAAGNMWQEQKPKSYRLS